MSDQISPDATRVALVQHCAGTDVEKNMATLEQYTRQAVAEGADVVMWPEAFAYLGSHRGKVEILEDLPAGGPILKQCQALGRELSCELLLGGFHERMPGDEQRCFNTSVYLGRDGEILAQYRKIHLFDVDIENGPKLQESKQTGAGETAVVVDTQLGRLGLTVCYDVRFPQLYQRLIDLGAIAITVPSAFTATTGALHWHALLRARAIECQCYILAPAQHGQHSEHRSSYGHSLIVDPWGKVIAELSDGDGYITADIEPAQVSKVRQEIPSLANRQPFK
ncbi:MAG: carbon-nitrogen hydrolase family protein [Pseudomonadota bacterium]